MKKETYILQGDGDSGGDTDASVIETHHGSDKRAMLCRKKEYIYICVCVLCICSCT